ncbi:MAG: phytoene desaturase family protein [Sphingomonadales bacterium]
MAGSSYDALVIGAGHNGLACAAILAKAGQKTLILEANETAGGLAGTREFTAGFSAPMAHSAAALPKTMIDELKLSSYGLEVGPALETVGLSEDGQHVHVIGDTVTGATDADAAAYPEYRAKLQRYAKVLKPIWEATLPRIGASSLKEALIYAQGALKMRMLGKEDMSEFLRILTLPMRDLVDEVFEDPKLQAVLSWDGLIGSKMAPRSPNNAVLPMLLRLGGVHGGDHMVPKGGMGAITKALLAAAQKQGVEVRFGAPIKKVIVEGSEAGQKATGVELVNGEIISAPKVISSADPKTTFFDLVGAPAFDVQFASRIKRLRAQGYVARFNAALSGLPDVPGLDGLSGRYIIAPSFDAIEFAFDDAKYGDASQHPVMEVTFPSVHDASLAPEGKHVLSAHVMYAPHDERSDWSHDARIRFTKAIGDALERHMPGIGSLIIQAELLTPKDIAADYHVAGGHWHHGEMALDQMLMMRPTYHAAQYSTPLQGLYLCGAGTHPGGGITGLPGRNAARQILR